VFVEKVTSTVLSDLSLDAEPNGASTAFSLTPQQA